MRHKFLLDENVEAVLLEAIARHNESSAPFIEAHRVGDPFDLPLGSTDPQILLWVERNGYILVSHDVSTLPEHLGNHLAAGHHCPGIFLVSGQADMKSVVELLGAASESDDPLEWQDLIERLG